MKVYSFGIRAKDGYVYNMRLLCTPEELEGLIQAGLVPRETANSEVVGWVYAEPKVIEAAGFVDRLRVRFATWFTQTERKRIEPT